MIIIDIKDSESIERALKRYKRKHRDLKIRQQLRSRQYFSKPSVERRNEVLDAAYRLKKYGK
jgi:small subunit ribosomal protein S21